MKRGLVSAMAALLVGGGGVMAQAPQPVPAFSNRPEPAPIRQVQATAQDLQGYGPEAGAPQGPWPPDSNLVGGATGEPVLSPAATQRLEPDWTVWANADYLLWKTNKFGVPPVASVVPAGVLAFAGTSSTTTITPQGPLTALSAAQFLIPVSAQTTSIGAGDINLGEQNGCRLSVGAWILPDELLGVEGTFIFLERRTFDFATEFTNNNNATNQFFLPTGLSIPASTVSIAVAVPGSTSSATATVTNPAQPLLLLGTASGAIGGTIDTAMLGGELNFRGIACWFGGFKIGALAGVRYLYLYEDFELNDNFTLTLTTPPNINVTAANMLANTTVTFTPNGQTFGALTNDAIRTRNNFYGPQVGVYAEYLCAGFFVNGQIKVAAGPNFQDVNIISASFLPTFNPGGTIFGPGDVGNHERTRFSLVPEANVKVGYTFFPWLKAYVGFDFLYYHNVVRPTNQAVSNAGVQVSVAGTTNTATVAPESFRFGDSNAWFEGFSMGMEIRY